MNIRLTRQKVPRERCTSSDYEEAESGHSSSISIFLGVESVQTGCNNQISRPYHTGGPHNEPSAQSCHGESSQLSCEDEQNVEAESERLLVPKLSTHNRIHDVSRTDGGIGHDDDESVFFDVEWTGIERPCTATEPFGIGICSNRQQPGDEFAARVNDDPEPSVQSKGDGEDSLNNEGRNDRCRSSKVEKSVGSGADDTEEDSEKPASHSQSYAR